MKCLFSLTFLILLAATSIFAQSGPPPAPAAENIQPSQSTAAKLTNHDVLVIPSGIQLDVEARYTVSSLDVKSGDLISFRVLVPIKVDGIVVIDKGALVTARVVEAKRGGHWGHAGRLSWSMQDVLAVDGSRIPLRPSDQLGSELAGAQDKKNSKSSNTGNSVKGTSHSTEVITKAIIPGILFPPLAPLGLIHGFKRGENAVLPEGKRFFAFVNSNTTILLKPAR